MGFAPELCWPRWLRGHAARSCWVRGTGTLFVELSYLEKAMQRARRGLGAQKQSVAASQELLGVCVHPGGSDGGGVGGKMCFSAGMVVRSVCFGQGRVHSLGCSWGSLQYRKPTAVFGFKVQSWNVSHKRSVKPRVSSEVRCGPRAHSSRTALVGRMEAAVTRGAPHPSSGQALCCMTVRIHFNRCPSRKEMSAGALFLLIQEY